MAAETSYVVSGKPEGPESNKTANGGFRKYIGPICLALLIFIVGLVGGILIGYFAFQSRNDSDNDSAGTVSMANSTDKNNGKNSSPVCSSRKAYIPNQSKEPMVFEPLTSSEMEESFQALIANGIIIKDESPYNFTANYVQYMTLHPPNKRQMLEHLEGEGQKPNRYAQVYTIRRGISSPDCMIFKVGPLGLGGATVEKLLQDGEIHINARPRDWFEMLNVFNVVEEDMEILSPLMAESFDGGKYLEDIFVIPVLSPFGITPEDRFTRASVGFRGLGPEDYDSTNILPLGFKVNTRSLNIKDWYATDFYYLDNGPFRSAQELMNAYNNNTIRKVRLPKGYRSKIRQLVFPTRENTVYRNLATTSAPRSYEPAGHRYSIQGNKVSWMGWEFYISGSQLKGPSVFDVRFKGERIVYELAFNEISLVYGSDTSSLNNVVYLDTAYAFMRGGIVRGLDCPTHATILNFTLFDYEILAPKEVPAMCLFEADGQQTTWRHVTENFQAGMTDHHLILRTPTTLGNYDYIIDYKFYLDGRIVTKARATGLVQVHFWDELNPNNGPDASNSPFGYRISDFHVGSIHDHTFGFKVDLDIVNEANTFKLVHWKAGDVLQALQTQNPDVQAMPSYFLFNQTRYVEWETVEKETRFNVDLINQKLWTVVNEDHKNKYRVSRGYQIVPMATVAQNFGSDYIPIDALSFTRNHLTVTKRKENEQQATSLYDCNSMTNVKNNLKTFLDAENITNEDIVMWVAVGFAHVPTSEDIPVTTDVESGFMLKPHNFYDRTATFDMPQYLRTDGGLTTEQEPDFEACLERKPDY